jgi:hypothetical protein
LTSASDLDPNFAAGITPATVVVDIVGTGRSFFRFAERNRSPGRALALFAFLDRLLKPDERVLAEQRAAEGGFDHVCRITCGGDGARADAAAAVVPAMEQALRAILAV